MALYDDEDDGHCVGEAVGSAMELACCVLLAAAVLLCGPLMLGLGLRPHGHRTGLIVAGFCVTAVVCVLALVAVRSALEDRHRGRARDAAVAAADAVLRASLCSLREAEAAAREAAACLERAEASRPLLLKEEAARLLLLKEEAARRLLLLRDELACLWAADQAARPAQERLHVSDLRRSVHAGRIVRRQGRQARDAYVDAGRLDWVREDRARRKVVWARTGPRLHDLCRAQLSDEQHQTSLAGRNAPCCVYVHDVPTLQELIMRLVRQDGPALEYLRSQRFGPWSLGTGWTAQTCSPTKVVVTGMKRPLADVDGHEDTETQCTVAAPPSADHHIVTILSVSARSVSAHSVSAHSVSARSVSARSVSAHIVSAHCRALPAVAGGV